MNKGLRLKAKDPRTPSGLAVHEEMIGPVWSGHAATRALIKAYFQGCSLFVAAGGSYAGKTAGILVGLYIIAQKVPGIKISISGLSLTQLKGDAIEFFDEIVYGSPTPFTHNKTAHRYTFADGSVIQFRALDSPKKARGPKQDITYFVEANLLPKETWEQASIRTRKMMVGCFNPTEKFWLVNEKYQADDPRHIFKRYTYDHNPFTPPKVAEELEGYSETNENLFRVYRKGLWGVNGL